MILKNITVTFGKRNKEKIVLAALNLTIDNCLIKGIHGGKASGKTTLVRVITNEIKPLTGEKIIFPDQYITVISKKNTNSILKKVKYISNIENYSDEAKDIEFKEILIVDNIEDFNEDALNSLIKKRKESKYLQTILLSRERERLKKYTDDLLYLRDGHL